MGEAGGGGLGGRADALVNEQTFCLPRQKVRVKVEIVAKTIPLDNRVFFIFLAISRNVKIIFLCVGKGYLGINRSCFVSFFH